MKTRLLKFALPIGMGLALLIITFFGVVSTTLVSCEKTCSSGQCEGTNGHCFSCSAGSYCTTSPSGNCSNPNNGVYCCTGSGGGGGGGGCTPTGCSSSSPWLCGGLCYATVPSGNHSCRKCP